MEKEILELSHSIGSTADIINYCNKSEADEFIICTEDGVLHQLEQNNPVKKFYFPEPNPCCADMKLNTLENIISVLEKEDNEVIVSEEICKKAIIPLNRMLELGK